VATPAFPGVGSPPGGTDVGVRGVELERQQKHDTLVTGHPDRFNAQQVQAASARLGTPLPDHQDRGRMPRPLPVSRHFLTWESVPSRTTTANSMQLSPELPLRLLLRQSVSE
jgi:hypothetical protein